MREVTGSPDYACISRNLGYQWISQFPLTGLGAFGNFLPLDASLQR
jgi:hypothetical protein